MFCATVGDGGTVDRHVDALADQACLDLPPAAFAAEVAFWRDLTGWAASEISDDDDFVSLRRPTDMPARILLQRRDDETPASAHVDFATIDRTAETERHVRAGPRWSRPSGSGPSCATPSAGSTASPTATRPPARPIDPGFGRPLDAWSPIRA